MNRNSLTYLALAILGLVVFLVFLSRAFPSALNSQDSQIQLVYGLGLLALVASSVILGWQNQSGLALKQAVIWAGLFVAVLVIYSYRQEFNGLLTRVGGEVAPSVAVNRSPGEVSLRAGRDGHFHASALVDGTHVDFLIDTGATLVSLSYFDAQRVGIDMDKLNFSQMISTANGQVFMAQTKLKEITVGGITLYDVSALVASEGLDESLLGMSFLRRLSSFRVDQDRLIMIR